jgi:leucyl-tRNA synthetase
MVRLGGTKMSKSKGNLVAPEDIFDAEGADALRLAHLFSGPPGDDVDWEGVGIEGCSRFLQRVWRAAVPGGDAVAAAEGDAAVEVDRAAHRLIQQITDDFEKWSYNTAVAHFMEFTNLLYKKGSTPFAVDTLLQLLAPAAPHVTAELWALRHEGDHVHERPWPTADAELAKVDSVEMVVQVNGKKRDVFDVDPGVSETEAEALALASPKVAEALGGLTPKKVIARPPKLVNIVV